MSSGALYLNVGCDQRRDRAGALSVSAVGVGLEKCLFLRAYCMWTRGEALKCDSDVYIPYETQNLELVKIRWNQITD